MAKKIKVAKVIDWSKVPEKVFQQALFELQLDMVFIGNSLHICQVTLDRLSKSINGELAQ